MKKTLCIVLALLLLVPAALAENTFELKTSLEILELLNARDYDAAHGYFSATLAEALSSEALAAACDNFYSMTGEYQYLIETSQTESDGFDVVMLQCVYENLGIVYTFSYKSHSLEGLFMDFSRVSEVMGADMPMGTVRETVYLREGEADQTMGELVLPYGDGPFPVVIMLAGSGPMDYNETVMGNHPFYDIASGLVELGVGSYRFDKYTLHNYAKLTDDAKARFTVREEYINDALAAIDRISLDPRVGDIYILGHSQGAMLTPRVIMEAGEGRIKGGIMLSGSPKHLWEVSYSQNLRLVPDEQFENYKTLLEQQVTLAMTLDELTEEELLTKQVFGVSAYYMRDEMSVDAAETAVKNGVPLFIAQGEADWQVDMQTGNEAWAEALECSGLYYVINSYKDLNHLLMTQAESPTYTMLDYANPGTVSKELIEDVADFIFTFE